MKVIDIMTKDPVTCNEKQTVSDAAKLMAEEGFSVMLIVNDDGALVGIVTESDFVGKEIEIPHALASLKRVLGENHYHGDIEEIYHNAKNRSLSEVMTEQPVFVGPQESLNDVVNKMNAKKLKRLPVVEDGKLVGIVTRKDLIKAFNKID
ncbi:MAG: CBS domain-containing protein [Bacteriovoracaceae bacterium]